MIVVWLAGRGDAERRSGNWPICAAHPTTALQAAIAAARAGATLAVTGTCEGNFAIGENLTLVRRGNTATLDGGGRGPVLLIGSRRVTLDRLTITNGSETSSTLRGGGITIFSGGTVTLNGTTVTGNHAHWAAASSSEAAAR